MGGGILGVQFFFWGGGKNFLDPQKFRFPTISSKNSSDYLEKKYGNIG